MKYRYLLVALVLSCSYASSNEVSHLESLDKRASDFRKMAIECVTDQKLSKKRIVEIETCKILHNFTNNGYADLKKNLIEAEENAKKEGQTKGLANPGLREKLILIMSAKSHMNSAGAITEKIK